MMGCLCEGQYVGTLCVCGSLLAVYYELMPYELADTMLSYLVGNIERTYMQGIISCAATKYMHSAQDWEPIPALNFRW